MVINLITISQKVMARKRKKKLTTIVKLKT